MAERKKSVVICGGGFAGLSAARSIARSPGMEHAQITVLDDSVFYVYHAWLYEVATFTIEHGISQKRLRDFVCIPTESLEYLFSETNIRFVQDRVTSVDLASKTVRCESGRSYQGDVVLYALGSITNDFGVPGVPEHTVGLKNLEDALTIHERIQELFRDVQLHPRQRKVVICGGGLSGVEVGAELMHYIRHMERDHALPEGRVTVEIIEAGPKILSMLRDSVRKIAEYRLKKLGVTVRLNTRITSIAHDEYAVEDGAVSRHDLFIWTGGVKPNPVVQNIPGMPLDGHSCIMTEPTLQVQGHPGVFALGDAAACMPLGGKHPLPATGQIAWKEGIAVGPNIAAYLTGKPLHAVHVKQEGPVVPLGGKWAIAVLGPHTVFSGFIGFVIRRIADFRYLRSLLPFWEAVRFVAEGTRVFSKND
ncbi:MAG: NAD(P)/FAD-dependent oxidoreductase [Patescibacteria group bacterium]|jgi:NADH dehydrogenase